MSSQRDPIKKENIQIPLNGINETVAAEVVSPSSALLTCNNFDFTSASKLSPRYGYAQTSADSPGGAAMSYETARFLKYKNRPILMGPRGIVEFMDSSLQCEQFSGNAPPAPTSFSKPPTLDPELLVNLNTNINGTEVYTSVTAYQAGGAEGFSCIFSVSKTVSGFPSGTTTETALSVRVVDNATGGTVGSCKQSLANTDPTTIVSFKVMQLGSKGVVAITKSGVGTIFLFAVDVTSASTISSGFTTATITGLQVAGNYIDATYDYTGSHTYGYLIYNRAAAPGTYRIQQIDGSLASGASADWAGRYVAETRAGITYVQTAGELIVSAVNPAGSDVDVLIYTASTVTLLPYTPPASIPFSAVCIYNVITSDPVYTNVAVYGNAWVYNFNVMAETANPSSSSISIANYVSCATPGVINANGSGSIRNCEFISKPVWCTSTQQVIGHFHYSIRYEYPLGSGTYVSDYSFSPKDYIVDITDSINLTAEDTFATGNFARGAIIATLASGAARGKSSLGVANPMPVVAGDSIYTSVQFIRALTYGSSLSTNSNAGTSYGIYRLRMKSPYLFGSAKAGDYSFTSGGVPCAFDGSQLLESGFPTRPMLYLSSTAAGAAVTGTFNYVAVYQHTDSLGSVTWSEASNIYSVALAVNSATFTIRCPTFSRRDRPYSQIQALLFRTVNNGQTYYLAGTAQVKDSASTVTITDANAAAAVASNQKLYYQPGQIGTPLPRQSPPSLRCVISHKDRLFGIDDQGQIRFTGPAVEGESRWWHDVFQFPVPGGSGNPTALASMQGRLIIFKADSIHVVDGDGPPENGGNGTEFSLPQLISGTTGCIEPRSIIVTQSGVMFKSVRGIELLTDSFSVQFIGDAVHRTVASYPTCTGVTYCAETDCVKWSMSSATETFGGLYGTGGIILCYFQKYGAWTTHTVQTDAAAAVSLSDLNYCYVKGKWITMLCTGGANTAGTATVFYEKKLSSLSSSAFIDPNSNPVVTTIETGWVKYQNAPNTQMRIWDAEVFGLPVANNSTLLSLAYNYSNSYTNTVTFQPTVTTALPLVLQVRADPERCYAVRLKVVCTYASNTGTYPYGTGEMPSWLGVSFNVGVKPGQPNIPATNKGSS
jgi:hypothetical protein